MSRIRKYVLTRKWIIYEVNRFENEKKTLNSKNLEN